jgi:hypothetical protein
MSQMIISSTNYYILHGWKKLTSDRCTISFRNPGAVKRRKFDVASVQVWALLICNKLAEFPSPQSDLPFQRSHIRLARHSLFTFELLHTVYSFIHSFIHSTVLQLFVEPWPLLQFRKFFYTGGRTPWTSDQPIARPLPKHRTTQHRINTHIHALSGIRTHDSSARASEDNSCFRPCGHCDRLSLLHTYS